MVLLLIPYLQVAFPVGLFESHCYIDTITIKDPSDVDVPISTDNIAWDVDIKNYKNIDPKKQWVNMQDRKRFCLFSFNNFFIL